MFTNFTNTVLRKWPAAQRRRRQLKAEQHGRACRSGDPRQQRLCSCNACVDVGGRLRRRGLGWRHIQNSSSQLPALSSDAAGIILEALGRRADEGLRALHEPQHTQRQERRPPPITHTNCGTSVGTHYLHMHCPTP